MNPRIATVIVLYQRRAAESEAFASYSDILSADPELSSHFVVLLYDNSPQAQPMPDTGPLRVSYVHDAGNGGLAAAYALALQRAGEEGRDWLLLLDQDTTVTREFLCELVDWAGRLEKDQTVAAIVPKLRSRQGEIYSPGAPFLEVVRRRLWRASYSVKPEVEGVQREPLAAFNSGAALRVSALRAIGGFPQDYWLDFLDHAVFHALNRLGYRTCVMRAMLEQNFSVTQPDSVPLWRQRNLLAAQSHFVMQNANLLDRLAYRRYLLAAGKRAARESRDKRVARDIFLQAVLLRRLPPRPPR